MTPPPSLPQLRLSLKQALAAERDDARRKELGRALKAIERAESRGVDKSAQKC